jgi:hypothetical protein
MTTKPKRQLAVSQPISRPDHEMIAVGSHLIPVLGTIGGTPEQSRETAQNIERYFATIHNSKRTKRTIP